MTKESFTTGCLPFTEAMRQEDGLRDHGGQDEREVRLLPPIVAGKTMIDHTDGFFYLPSYSRVIAKLGDISI